MRHNDSKKRRMCARIFGFAFLAAVSVVVPAAALAQTDEIQVYDASIAPVGVFNLTWHNNYTPDGLTKPSYPGAVISDESWNGVPEWAYGLTSWWEQGLYLPIYSVSKNHGATFDGFKVRELFVRPHAEDHKFFYGLNFEFSYNKSYWENRTGSMEIRPIVGWHLHPWDIIINPIVDSDYTGGIKNLHLNPAERLAYNFNTKWAGAIEEYGEYGPLKSIYGASGQTHQLWFVTDYSSKVVNIEAGVGVGLTSSTDHVILKLMFSHDFNTKPWPPSRRVSSAPTP